MIPLYYSFSVVIAGFENARALSLHGAHVVLACRNMRSANAAVNAIKTENVSAEVEAMFVDLTSLKTVANFASSYINRNMYASYAVIQFTLQDIYAQFYELGISRESRYILGIRKKSVLWTLKSQAIPWIRHLGITRRWPRNKLGITMATNFVDNSDKDIDVYWNLLHRLTIII